MPYLKAETEPRHGRFALEASVLIGRAKSCDIVLDDPQVSREHARIERRGEEWVIEDLGSRHGTFVNGFRLAQATALRPHDSIVLCSHRFTFLAEGGLAEAGARAASLAPAAHAAQALDEVVVMSARDASRDSGLDAVEVRPEAKLRALLEITRSLQSALRVDELLPRILESLFRIFPQAERGFVLLVDEEGELVPKAARGRGPQGDGSVPVSQTIVRRCLEAKEAILSADARGDRQFGVSESISSLHIRSILCVPLVGRRSEPLGVLQVHSEEEGRAFTEEDLEVLASVAGTMAMALESARLHEERMARERIVRERELARDVQRRFLPAGGPNLPGYSFFPFYRAADTVGGDYYGFIELLDGRLAVALGDVSGKGMPAAMLMARLSSDVRYAAAASPDPATALDSVNRSLREADMDDRFVTLVLVVLEPRTGALAIANAGHLYPLVRRADGRLEDLGVGLAGAPLNVSPDPNYRYRAAAASLERGSTLLLFSDGITEARDSSSEMYGSERLRERFRVAPPGAGAGRSVVDDVLRFATAEEQHDDMTLIAIGRDP
jgi:serine phosphatase RsbU (regulator of sigma subunit)